MHIRSKQELTRLEINRPVVAGLEQFLDTVEALGRTAFGERYAGHINTPVIQENEEGELEPLMQGVPMSASRLMIYRNGELSMNLLGRYALPQDKFAKNFRAAHGPLINRAVESGEEGTAFKSGRNSLQYALDTIAEEHGINNSEEIRVSCKSIDVLVDPLLEHTGMEVVLKPDPNQKVTRMLIHQSAFCYRALYRRSRRSAMPLNPTALSIPFARMPSGATDNEIGRFLTSIEDHLPQHAYLGEFSDSVGTPSWREEPGRLP